MAQSHEFVVKKNAWDGLALAMKIYLPLSIISFFNEAINGQFCMWTECDYPPYYAVPRILAMLFGLILLITAGVSRAKLETHKKGYAWGLVLGVIIGIAMFLFISAVGWMQSD